MGYTERLIACFIILACASKVRAQCSGSPTDITISTYEIGSFTYPSSGLYTQNLNCAWLRNPSGSSSEDFLMYVSITQLTANDILTIYNGTDNTGSNLYTSPNSGTSSLSFTLIATSGNAYITFVSDGTGDANQHGFTIQYMTASSNSAAGCSSPASLTATDTTQYLTSGNFPSKYSSDSDCTWSISTQDSCGSIVLDFIYIDIESDSTCDYDKLTVTYDGSSQPNLCPTNDWNSASDHSTTGTSASINLVSDNGQEHHGFVMSYTRTGCATSTSNGATASTGATSEEGADPGLIAVATVVPVAGVGAFGTLFALKLKSMIGSKASVKPSTTQNGGDIKKGDGQTATLTEAENGTAPD
ncbi:embryonic protein UVS.2-like [Pecten maximus]|uniref:embryonic protein UVS.2-like n=1 Tax=Pecten maximus TaxID=6579 RepID=UPI00145811BC|nr:embryonic protein UVS.2-like [Pecten maximus]